MSWYVAAIVIVIVTKHYYSPVFNEATYGITFWSYTHSARHAVLYHLVPVWTEYDNSLFSLLMWAAERICIMRFILPRNVFTIWWSTWRSRKPSGREPLAQHDIAARWRWQLDIFVLTDRTDNITYRHPSLKTYPFERLFLMQAGLFQGMRVQFYSCTVILFVLIRLFDYSSRGPLELTWEMFMIQLLEE